MSAFTPASEVLLRHSDDFESARVLFAGDLQDDLPARLDTAASRAHTQQFHHWQVLNRQMGDTVRFSLVAEAADVAECDTLNLLLAKEQTRGAVPADEPALSAAGGKRHFRRR
ncbi:ribosomal RNA small subunit methyltransferase C [Klebsiella pneumoniae]|uniref:Ribosomal RNA small subunit methyltransferase C n=1 Tax=Klebsiella pneumoniae TaxID=573 RepID=A0A378FYN3_KLEPN|nr:ribosomal RNA small subunit methyltransferase C [Klebsiella pneumoniae]